jgi:hypothetical protein
MSEAPDVAPLHRALLALHKTLLGWARREYEREHGRQSDVAFLQLLTSDAGFEWLGPLTSMIVAIDEIEAEPNGHEGVRALLVADANGSPFQQRYALALQQDPTVAVAHGGVMRALAK